jgi:hypothetical protein
MQVGSKIARDVCSATPRICYSCAWSPTYRNAGRHIESVQRNFTKRLPGFTHIDYDGRLAKLNIDSLELRRLHLDLICVFKILFGLIDVHASDFFSFQNNAYYPYKLQGTNAVSTPAFVSLPSAS